MIILYKSDIASEAVSHSATCSTNLLWVSWGEVMLVLCKKFMETDSKTASWRANWEHAIFKPVSHAWKYSNWKAVGIYCQR